MTSRDIASLIASICRESFADFVRRFFPVVTGRKLERNHAIDAMIAALQAVGDGRITRLLIAVPPGLGKTTLLCLYAGWRLARNPAWRSIHASHAFGLAATESRRVRRLVESDEYRGLFAVRLRADEASVEHWATTKDGRYFAAGTDSGLTGRRAHEAVLDDPLNATDRFSKAARDALWAWFQESLSTRLDGDRAPIVIVQQRLDRDDLIGKLLEQGGFVLLELAAEFDPERRCTVLADDGTHVWSDPRTEAGELLAANVLPADKIATLKLQIGSATFATQYLQRPSDDSSAVIKRAWWRFHHMLHVAEHAPRPVGCNTDVPAILTPETFSQIVIAADLTFGAKSAKSDFVSIQAWAADGAARYLLARWKKRAGLLESVDAIKALRVEYPSAKIIIEKAANGAGAIEELAAAGVHGVLAIKPIGSKAERIGMVSATIEAGNCFLPLGAPWLGDFVEELAGATTHDDDQDAAAYAIHELNRSALAAFDNHGGYSSLDRERSVDAVPDADGSTLMYSSIGEARR